MSITLFITVLLLTISSLKCEDEENDQYGNARHRDVKVFVDVYNHPKTSFSCVDKKAGEYYADIETNCAVYYICLANQYNKLSPISFACPNGTIFNQANKVCTPHEQVSCDLATRFYDAHRGLSIKFQLLHPFFKFTQIGYIDSKDQDPNLFSPVLDNAKPWTVNANTNSNSRPRNQPAPQENRRPIEEPRRPPQESRRPSEESRRPNEESRRTSSQESRRPIVEEPPRRPPQEHRRPPTEETRKPTEEIRRPNLDFRRPPFNKPPPVDIPSPPLPPSLPPYQPPPRFVPPNLLPQRFSQPLSLPVTPQSAPLPVPNPAPASRPLFNRSNDDVVIRRKGTLPTIPSDYVTTALPEVTIKETDFTCTDKVAGLAYADIANDCKMLHICLPIGKGKFDDHRVFCKSGYGYNQKAGVCDLLTNFECNRSLDYYVYDKFANHDLYRKNLMKQFRKKSTPKPITSRFN
ncbi:hypothetical protein B4U80_02118 [Leptotrombidium deliense]|uniref:Chitin-binding type-2 domain-containing protein n=1 Tax=Leptotrombidium deliense TaxID=299467 RepID=A0A443S7B6_9ACAR|nr:hypothetical protein B4U80_02118 [Leptotrombidium deliense]